MKKYIFDYYSVRPLQLGIAICSRGLTFVEHSLMEPTHPHKGISH